MRQIAPMLTLATSDPATPEVVAAPDLAARKAARAARRLGDLARGRVRNTWLRMAGAAAVAILCGIVSQSWLPAYWAFGFCVVLLIERSVHSRIAKACEAGAPPRSVAAALLWTAAQASYAGTLAVWLWYAPYPHHETAATFFMVACLANAAASMHTDLRFMAFGCAPTLACMFGLPISQFAMSGFQWTHLTPALAAALYLTFGYSLWRSLRASEAAQWQAETAALRARQARASAQTAQTETLARVQNELRTPVAALMGAAEKLRHLKQKFGACGRAQPSGGRVAPCGARPCIRRNRRRRATRITP